MLKEVPSTVVSNSPDLMTKGLVVSVATSKKASPESSTSRCPPWKCSGYFRLLPEFRRTLVPSARVRLSFCPHWVFPVRCRGGTGPWGFPVGAKREWPSPKRRAMPAARATPFQEALLILVPLERRSRLGAGGRGKRFGWFLDNRPASKLSKRASSLLVMVPSRYFPIKALISFSVILRWLYPEVPKSVYYAHSMALF